MGSRTTIYLAAWGDPHSYGYGSSAWTLERDPAWLEHGDGRLWALTPTRAELLAIAAHEPTGRKAYKQRLFRYHETTGGLAPGQLLAFAYEHTTGEPVFAVHVEDGDTLATRPDRPWRPWAARALRWAGWDVVCDRVPLQPR